jgi:hypothetical protein
VYGDAAANIVEVCRQRRLALHVFPWQDAMRRACLRRHAGYLIRPDGHAGLADLLRTPPRCRRTLTSAPSASPANSQSIKGWAMLSLPALISVGSVFADELYSTAQRA